MVEIINAFLSYMALVLVIVTVGGIAIFSGIKLRKWRDAKAAQCMEETVSAEE